MKQLELQAIRETPEYYDKINTEIIELLREHLYLPLIAIIGLKKKVIQNSTDDLLEAIRSGQIFYTRGNFEGKFDASISRSLKQLGAKWDRSHSSWRIKKWDMPIEVVNAIIVSESKFNQVLSKIDDKLAKMVPAEIADKLKIEDLFDTTLWRIEKDFQKSIKGISIAPELSASDRKRMSEEYTKNMQLYVRDFTEKEIVKLRRNIEETAFSGFRYESMITKIKESYGVSVNKARFLAKQETSLLMTKYKQIRYQDAGVNEYKWVCVHMPHQGKNAPYKKGEVRHDHAILNNKIFRWDSPPVVNDKGERKNPGQDYGCRCTAIPIVRF